MNVLKPLVQQCFLPLCTTAGQSTGQSMGAKQRTKGDDVMYDDIKVTGGGYFIMSRNLMKEPRYMALKAVHRIILLELFKLAAYEDGPVVRGGEVIELKRGQVATSYQDLLDFIGAPDVTIKILRVAIDKFIKCGFVAKDEAKSRAKKGLLLTLIDYGFYQDPSNFEGKAKGKEEGKARAKQGQYIKKDKEVEEDKEENNIVPIEQPDPIPYKEIVDYLNESAGTKYKATTQKTKELIKSRYNNGFNLDDFKTVIDKKTAEWIGQEQEKYLRPETLFGNKFEGYLNQKGGGNHGRGSGLPEYKGTAGQRHYGTTGKFERIDENKAARAREPIDESEFAGLR